MRITVQLIQPGTGPQSPGGVLMYNRVQRILKATAGYIEFVSSDGSTIKSTLNFHAELSKEDESESRIEPSSLVTV